MDGNTAVIMCERESSDAAGAYPITPSTQMGEGWAQAVAAGKTNVNGRRLIFFEPEGEHAAALVEFKEAYRLRPSYKLKYNIGLVYAELRQYGQAQLSLQEYLEEGGDEIDVNRRAEVDKELAGQPGHGRLRLFLSQTLYGDSTDWSLLGGFLWRPSNTWRIGAVFRQGPELALSGEKTAGLRSLELIGKLLKVGWSSVLAAVIVPTKR